MESSYSQSTFEILPDEILLEVCKYLLCTDILYSFTGLNYRMTRMISEYRQHLSFHKTSISKCDYLCINVLPQISSQIRSLVIDCCYSVLQDQLFIKHFGEKMSITFPNLERISLVSYEYDSLLYFLNTLHDLNYLVEIHLYGLVSIPELRQPTLVRSLFQANNHRLTTIFLDDHSSFLSFDNIDCYLNILQLRIKLQTITELSSLFAAVPNVQHLHVILENSDHSSENLPLTNMKSSPLLYLTNFQLESLTNLRVLEELITLFIHLPIVRSLSLVLFTYDQRLIKSDIVLSSLPSTVQQFNYAIYFISHTTLDKEDTIISSWPPSHPVACFFSEELLFLHTLPWRFARLEYLSFADKIMSSDKNTPSGYDRQVEQFYLMNNMNLIFGKSLIILPQCRRVKEISIYVNDYAGGAVEDEQLPVPNLPKLPRLTEVCFYGSMPSDLNYFSFILHAASNLLRLDLPFAHLLRLIKDQQICSILNQRITTLCISENEANPALPTINEEHVPIIASVFSRVRFMYVNITHLPSSTTLVSSEDIPQDLSIQSNEQKNEVIAQFSSESMLLCLSTNFKEHGLISLCIEGEFPKKMKTDPGQWLQSNTNLCEQHFQAAFYRELKELFIWM